MRSFRWNMTSGESNYRPQRRCGQVYVFTCVCDSVHRGVLSQHALQQVSGGGSPCWGGLLARGISLPGGGLLARGSPCQRGLLAGRRAFMAFWCVGLLLWPSGLVAFCYGGLLIEVGLLVESGLLSWPSGMAFWYWGVFPNRDPFQPEGHNRRPHPPSPKKTATVADGTHPTVTYSCS